MSEDFRYIIRFEGTDLKVELPLYQALTKVKGIGLRFSRTILNQLDIDPQQRVGYVSDKDLKRISDTIKDPALAGIPIWFLNRQKDPALGTNHHVTGSDLLLANKTDIDFHKRLRTYRGTRHQLGLKVRGQRTRTTGRKGRTLGVSKKAQKSQTSKTQESGKSAKD